MWTQVRTAREGMLAEVHEPSPGPWFADGVMTALGRAVGFDGYCLFGVDPVTQLRSVMFSINSLTSSAERLYDNETTVCDANRYSDLARGRMHAGVLAAGAATEPTSPRLHEMLRPDGFTSELRLALVSGGRYWGAVSLFRDSSRHPFVEADAQIANELSEPLSLAIRRYQVGWPGAPAGPAADGVVVFDRSGQALAASVEAKAWMAALAQSWPGGAQAEDFERPVIEAARAAYETRNATVCRVRVPAGGWLAISATHVEHDDGGVVAVLRAGDPATVAPAFAALCGFTAAEDRVLAELATGAAAKQIARRLRLSVLTINDHLASMYRKAGVRGRSELASLLS
ncbi:MAG TPA: LuxR C-terminal-related transcriptional regulator [Nocardioidaceae bacterium]|nr:LuxR C-terminal-related transcriptional regulator [Nocardioidaceae bacterium]